MDEDAEMEKKDQRCSLFSDLRLRYVKGMEGAHGRFNVVLPTGTLLDKICMQTPSASVEAWLPRKRGKPSE